LKECALGSSCKNNNIDELIIGNEKVTTDEDIANKFNEFFSKVGSKIRDDIPTFRCKPEDLIPDYDETKTTLEFERIGPIWLTDIVKSFPSKSSCDLDGISLKLLKNVIHQIVTPLSHIFNKSLELGIFPEKLKESRVVPIFKAGDPKLADNYRPISLVNTLSKILEKIVSIKLTNHLQINKLLYKHQYGFQRGLSTELNLVQVVSKISKALNNGEYCIGVFLDLKKAFDVCSHDILLTKLSKLGIKNKELDWFKSYLENRRQKVEIKNTRSTEEIINISVLQGTILGPILFLCYINDIFMLLTCLCFYLLMTRQLLPRIKISMS
jgi:hypothetical protein